MIQLAKIRKARPKTKPKTATVRIAKVYKANKKKKQPTFRSTVSPIECILAKYLKESGLLYRSQYRVARLGRYRGRYYFLDFALVDYAIGIECDGKAFHSKPVAIRRDKARQKELEAMGWKIIRFTGSEIVSNPRACVNQVINYIETIR